MSCFWWIFLGAPNVERLRENAVLTAITAAVVGVVLNLAIWVARHVVFREAGAFTADGLNIAAPIVTTIDFAASLPSVAALSATFRYKVGMATLLTGAAGLGVVFGVSGMIVQ